MRGSFTGIAITILSTIPWLAWAGEEPQKITDLSGVWVAEFNQDGSTIIVQNRNGTLGLWDTEKGSPIAGDIGIHNIKGRYAVSDDHSLVLISPEEGLPRVFDLSTGRAISPELKVTIKPENPSVLRLIFRLIIPAYYSLMSREIPKSMSCHPVN